ncbi:MAG: circadian clock protein KaiA [Cyanobacteria bacterium J06638_28]
MHSQLLIGSFIQSPELLQALETELDAQSYRIHTGVSEEAFSQWVSRNRHRIDCLILEPSAGLLALLESLQAKGIFLPALFWSDTASASEPSSQSFGNSQDVANAYHKAILNLPSVDLPKLEHYIHQAIEQFLKLPHNNGDENVELTSLEDTHHFLLSLQQQRLAEKLKERLGYLGVYYKRNPEGFLRNLSASERLQVLEKLRSDYRAIILRYFVQDDTLNAKIDDFVNSGFFADVSVSQIVEIHMELMESFSKQLKLEGRSEEILLDYRLTLIDVIAHLCEMYRRSIPRNM